MVSTTINVHAAKTSFSRLLERVEAGEEIVMARAGKPVARLVPLRAHRPTREPGLLRGRVRMTADFDAPLPPAVLAAFTSGAIEPLPPRRRRRS